MIIFNNLIYNILVKGYMWKKSLLLSLYLGISISVYAQSQEAIDIANEYFYKGDYEKALVEYEGILRNRRNIPLVHNNYVNLLIREKLYTKAEKHIKRAQKDYPDNFMYDVDLGWLKGTQGKELEAKEIYLEVINDVTTRASTTGNTNQVRTLAQKFYAKGLNEYALDTYLESRKKLMSPELYSLDLANLYRLVNQKEQMVREYLTFANVQQRNASYVKNTFQRLLVEKEDLDTLEIVLYDLMQEDVGNVTYTDFLIWTHLQQKNFSAALRQAKSVDRRLKNEGRNSINVGMIAFRNKDYRTAERAFSYVLSDFPEGANQRLAQKYSLLAKEEVIKSDYPVNETKVRDLIDDYKVYQDQSRDVISVMESQRRIALLQAFQLNEIDSAIQTLNSLLDQPVGRQKIIAEAKMDLADIYLLDQQPWESLLLYGQVEREYKDAPLGYTAKLKSAKLSYFQGEFEMALGHLDILKLATSREIANDALELSVLIKNNTVFDSTDLAMQSYSQIELLLFQNKREKALDKILMMLDKWPGHSLTDELYMIKAITERELGDFEAALQSLEKITNTYYYDILGDNALFLTAQILDYDLNRKEEAMQYYEDFLTKYPGSIFVSESRDRFRELRGDFNN